MLESKWRIVVGFARRTTVVSFRRTTAKGYNRQRTTMVGFKWRMLVVRGELQVENLQLTNTGGLPQRTTVVNIIWRTRAMSDREQRWWASNGACY